MTPDKDKYRQGHSVGEVGSMVLTLPVGGAAGALRGLSVAGTRVLGRLRGVPKPVAGPNGALRDPLTGRFVKNPEKKQSPAPATGSAHGNSRASTAETHLYRLEDQKGNLLKWGITSNLKGRYTQKFLEDKNMIPMTSGPRDQMLNLERWIVERNPGPLNKERWAGTVNGR